MSTTPLVTVEEVVKAYDGVVAVDRVDMQIAPGEVVGLVGKNGAGKSTLIKILAGAERADAGQVLVNGQPLPAHYAPHVAHELGLAFMHQELAIVADMSVAENIALGSRFPRQAKVLISKGALGRNAAEVLAGLDPEIDPRAKVGDLSKAKQRIVMIARALYHDARLLVLDEPSASLTEREVQQLHAIVARLRSSGRSVLYVSHRLQEILRITDRVVVMRDGRVVLVSETARLSEQSLIQAIIGETLATRERRHRPIPAPADRDVLLRVRNLRTDSGVRGVSFDLAAGEILGLGGLMGSGRSEVVRAIYGADRKREGSIELRGRKLSIRSPHKAVNAGFGLLPEDRRHEGLVPTLNVMRNVTLASLEKHRIGPLPFPSPGSERRATNRLVERLSIRTPRIDADVFHLSGGNQQKVVLARWLEKSADVLIFDEPTVGVDVGARQEVFSLIEELAESGKGVILISSDTSELVLLCHRVVVLAEGRVAGELDSEEITDEAITRLSYAAA